MVKRLGRWAAFTLILFLGCFPFFSLKAAEQMESEIAWLFEGPSNLEYEWTTISTTGEGKVFTVVRGESWKFGTENGIFEETGSKVVALDLSTGREKWSYGTRFPIFSPLLYIEGRLIIHDGYGEIFCLEASTGKFIWSVDPEREGLEVDEAPMPIMGPWDEQTIPSGKEGQIYLRERGDLVCRNLMDGKTVWRIAINAISNRKVFPALAGDKIILSTASDDVICLDAGTGKELWKKSPTWLDSSTLASADFACFSNGDGLMCVDTSTGEGEWVYGKMGPTVVDPSLKIGRARVLAYKNDRIFIHQNWVRSSVNEMGDTVIDESRYEAIHGGDSVELQQGSELAVLDFKTKKILWTYSIEENFSGFSIAGEHGVLVQGNVVTIIHLDSGKLVNQIKVTPEESLQGQALVVDGKILAVGKKGLYCFETGYPGLTGWSQSEGSSLRSGSI